jgi:hypothetical protein
VEKGNKNKNPLSKVCSPTAKENGAPLQKLKNALIASTEEFKGVIVNKHSIW